MMEEGMKITNELQFLVDVHSALFCIIKFIVGNDSDGGDTPSKRIHMYITSKHKLKCKEGGLSYFYEGRE